MGSCSGRWNVLKNKTRGSSTTNRANRDNNDNNKNHEKSEVGENKKAGFFLFLLLIVFTLFISYTAYLKSNEKGLLKVDFKNLISSLITENPTGTEKEEDIEIMYEVKNKPSFQVYKDLIIKGTTFSITALNKKGEEQWSIPILLSKPLMQSSQAGIFVADIGGRAIYLIEGNNIKWKTSVDGDIINAHINDKGFVSVVHKAEGYKGAIIIFDPEGREIFKRFIADTFILSCQVFPTSQQIAINSLDITGTNVGSHIEFTDLSGEPFAALVPEPEDIFPFLFPLTDNSFALMSDTTFVYYNKNREKLWENKYKEIYAAGVISDKSFVLASNQDSNKDNASDISILNKDGKEIMKQVVQGKVYSMSTFNEIIAVNNKREVFFFNSKGGLVNKYSSISDVERVLFLNRGQVALITKNSIIIVKI